MNDANTGATAEAGLPCAGRIVGATHILPLRVYYEDTDAGGVVYHANYLRFCERARTDFLRLLDIRHGRVHSDSGRPLAFVVRRMECDFAAPARLDDVLQVRSRVMEAGRVRIRLGQEIHRLENGEASERTAPRTGPIFSALVTIAVIDDSGRPGRLPKDIMRRLSRLRAED